jgi:hypothetical protein
MRAPRTQVFTGDDVAEEYGVNKSSYEAVVLPNIRAYQARIAHALSMLCAPHKHTLTPTRVLRCAATRWARRLRRWR